MAIYEAVVDLFEKPVSVNRSRLEEVRTGMRERAREARLSELKALRANAEAGRASWGAQTLHGVYGHWESGLDSFDRTFSYVLHRHGIAQYLNRTYKTIPSISVLELGGTAGQLSIDLRAGLAAKDVRVTGVSLVNPITEGGTQTKESPFKKLPGHDVITADIFSAREHSGEVKPPKLLVKESPVVISLSGRNVIPGKQKLVILRLIGPTANMLSPEKMFIEKEMIEDAYRLLDEDGTLLMALSPDFPLKRFADAVGRLPGIKIEIPRGATSQTMLVKRSAKSPESISEALQKKRLFVEKP